MNYREQAYWLRYQPFFPPYARLDAGSAPAEEWFDFEGTPIHLDRYARPEAPLSVIIVHGGGGYGRLFAPVGRRLANAGYEVIAPDLPGYGLSHAEAGLVDYRVWVRVLCALVRAERARSGGRSVVLCGGSLGGYLAYLTAAALGRAEAPAGLIATTLADPRDASTKAQFARNTLTRRLGLPLLPLVAWLVGQLRLPIRWFTKMDAMSNEPALSRLVAMDPLGGGVRVPVGFMRSIFAVQPAIEPQDFDLCPVLLAHPGEDRWTGPESSLAFYARLKAPKSLLMLQGCGHFPVEEPGFTQMEQAALDFLAALAARPASGKT